MKDAAEMYAIGSIGKEDVQYLASLHGPAIPFENMPEEFHKYVKEYEARYNDLCKQKTS